MTNTKYVYCYSHSEHCCTDDPNVLLQELQSLTEVLVHSQSHLRKHIDEHLKVDDHIWHMMSVHL